MKLSIHVVFEGSLENDLWVDEDGPTELVRPLKKDERLAIVSQLMAHKADVTTIWSHKNPDVYPPLLMAFRLEEMNDDDSDNSLVDPNIREPGVAVRKLATREAGPLHTASFLCAIKALLNAGAEARDIKGHTVLCYYAKEVTYRFCVACYGRR